MKEKEDGEHWDRVSSGGGGKAIFVGSALKGICLAYHIREDRWICLPDSIPFSYHTSLLVVDGDIL